MVWPTNSTNGGLDMAVLEYLERAAVSKKKAKRKKSKTKKAEEAALKAESDRALVEQIRRLLALPMNKRTHFLRVRHPNGGSHL
jgi:hypothetical protein